MKLRNVKEAICEAYRFLERAENLVRDPSEKESATRRASLDLTKALSKMRNEK